MLADLEPEGVCCSLFVCYISSDHFRCLFEAPGLAGPDCASGVCLFLADSLWAVGQLFP